MKKVAVKLTFSKWKIDRLVYMFELSPQESNDRDLVIKLWNAQRWFKEPLKKAKRK